jgi:hypothetical protein
LHEAIAVMKFETHVHHLFDAIRRGKVRAGFTPASNEQWLKSLQATAHVMEAAPVYVVNEPFDDLIRSDVVIEAQHANEKGQIYVPGGAFIMEGLIRAKDLNGKVGLNTRWVVLLWQSEESYMQAIHFFANAAADSVWLANPYVPQVHSGKTEIQNAVMVITDANPPEKNQELADRLEDDAMQATVLAATLAHLLIAPPIEMKGHEVSVPREINRGRRLMKRAPVPQHTVLTLPRLTYVHAADQQAHGTHASPRTHWRRSHERHYASGKVVRVSETVVNHRPGSPLPPPPVTEVRINL